MQKEQKVFFVVGAAKSGTSSLYKYLKSHPEIHMCPHKDVVCYFCRHYGLPVTLDEYKEMLLPAGNYSVAGDVCHAYLTDRKSAQWIHDVFPDAKIIVLLRNPADKAFSNIIGWSATGMSILILLKKLFYLRMIVVLEMYEK